MNQSVYQAGRAWVARHGMSTYKDTTPHISFRTGPPSSRPRANIRMGAQAAPFRRLSRVCVGEARLLPVTVTARAPRAQEDSEVLSGCAMYTTLFFGWQTEARTGPRNLTQLKIFRLLLFHKFPLTLPERN